MWSKYIFDAIQPKQALGPAPHTVRCGPTANTTCMTCPKNTSVICNKWDIYTDAPKYLSYAPHYASHAKRLLAERREFNKQHSQVRGKNVVEYNMFDVLPTLAPSRQSDTALYSCKWMNTPI